MERTDFTLDDIAGALEYLNESDRDTWIEMGMAIRSEFGDEGFPIWDYWSSGYAKYKPSVCKTTWRSFRKRGISLGTLVKKALDAGWKPRQMDEQERRALAELSAVRRAKAAEEMALDEERALKLQAAVAICATELCDLLLDDGKSPYLARKKVAAFGLKFVQQGVIIETDEDACTVRLITGADAIQQYFKNPPAEDSPRSFKHLKPGVVVMPLVDQGLMVWNVQIIFASGRKSFMKGGRKSGLFHLISGEAEADSDVYAVAEGYATGASVRMAMGWNVAVALDSGNLPKVAALLPSIFPGKTYAVIADNDVATDGNPGVTKGTEAAALINAHLAIPQFQGVA